MAWPNPFRKRDENTRTYWGYTFQWTPEHKTAEDLHPLKFSYDQLADDCVDRLDAICPPTAPVNGRPRPEGEKHKQQRDLYAILRDNKDKDEKLGELWEQVNTVPDWVDWGQIGRGQEVFYRYGVPAVNALGFESLLGGMGAGRVVETLARTGGFSTKVAKRRLYETMQHILQCTMSVDSIKPGGDGMASSVRVRLLHSMVRKRIMKLAESNPEYYDVEQYGIPINDLDSIGTIGTFSTILVWLGLPRQGIFMREQEIIDYIALWRLVAYYMGTPTESFKDAATARIMMESIVASEVNPTPTSQILANNIITSLENIPPTYASRGFYEANARWLNGKDLADALAIGNPSLYYWALMLGYCVFVSLTCYISRSWPELDKLQIQRRRWLIWKNIILDEKNGLGKETTFEFKYVPNLSRTTTKLGKPSGRSKPTRNFGVEVVGIIGLVLLALMVAGLRYILYPAVRASFAWLARIAFAA